MKDIEEIWQKFINTDKGKALLALIPQGPAFELFEAGVQKGEEQTLISVSKAIQNLKLMVFSANNEMYGHIEQDKTGKYIIKWTDGTWNEISDNTDLEPIFQRND
jgi:hypothetical protein